MDDSVKIFYRDINLKEEYSKNYYKGQILIEKGFVDMSIKRGGPFTTHRYVIISSKNICSKVMEDDEDWGLYTIGRNELFHLKEIKVIDNVTYYILIHINSDLKIDEKKFTKMALKMIKEDSSKKPDFTVATISWLDRCKFPLGMDLNAKLFTK